MYKLILLAGVMVILLSGCNAGTSEAQEKAQLEAHVMAVHDSAMAEMDQIFKLRRNLRALRDTLATQQTDTATLQLLQQHITGLSLADESMMQWMRNYKKPDTLQHQQAMTYLNEELRKIERVKVIMDSTIDVARQAYTQHEQ